MARSSSDNRPPGVPARGSSPGDSRWGAMWLMVVLLCVGCAALLLPTDRPQGIMMWTFAREHQLMYEPLVERWNEELASGLAPADGSPPLQSPFHVRLLGLPALQRRMMSHFMAGTPSSDLMEVERQMAGRTFLGPLDAVGFVDLTDVLRDEGLLEKMPAASFSPWTSRGRIFGLPHDVHPVMLAYRADIFDAAKIDVSSIETWDDLERVARPLMDVDGDGKPDRYLLNMWETQRDHLELLILQAGGSFFDAEERVVIDSPENAMVLAKVVRWCRGPDAIAADAPNFSPAGNKLRADGFVLTGFVPDWMLGIWSREIPSLAGKVRVMPLPAFERGGRRTSVWGGTMLGIPKTAARTPESFRERWSIAKRLYLSKQLATDLWKTGGIITPVREHWSDPVFAEPVAFLGGQRSGLEYIALADHVPSRSSSPFNTQALERVQRALQDLSEDAQAAGNFDEEWLRERAKIHLRRAHDLIQAVVDRNVFLRDDRANATERQTAHTPEALR
ncbi:MAG: extracellular solute-binding protein [Planctomycetota bacterium]|nr:extracellular solute-binding protein [Planctomycetota bacterium]